MIIYIVAVLVANYTATWFIPLPIFGMVSVGTLVFGITFTQRDRVHRYGRKVVYLMIFINDLITAPIYLNYSDLASHQTHKAHF